MVQAPSKIILCLDKYLYSQYHIDNVINIIDNQDYKKKDTLIDYTIIDLTKNNNSVNISYHYKMHIYETVFKDSLDELRNSLNELIPNEAIELRYELIMNTNLMYDFFSSKFYSNTGDYIDLYKIDIFNSKNKNFNFNSFGKNNLKLMLGGGILSNNLQNNISSNTSVINQNNLNTPFSANLNNSSKSNNLDNMLINNVSNDVHNNNNGQNYYNFRSYSLFKEFEAKFNIINNISEFNESKIKSAFLKFNISFFEGLDPSDHIKLSNKNYLSIDLDRFLNDTFSYYRNNDFIYEAIKEFYLGPSFDLFIQSLNYVIELKKNKAYSKSTFNITNNKCNKSNNNNNNCYNTFNITNTNNINNYINLNETYYNYIYNSHYFLSTIDVNNLDSYRTATITDDFEYLGYQLFLKGYYYLKNNLNFEKLVNYFSKDIFSNTISIGSIPFEKLPYNQISIFKDDIHRSSIKHAYVLSNEDFKLDKQIIEAGTILYNFNIKNNISKSNDLFNKKDTRGDFKLTTTTNDYINKNNNKKTKQILKNNFNNKSSLTNKVTLNNDKDILKKVNILKNELLYDYFKSIIKLKNKDIIYNFLNINIKNNLTVNSSKNLINNNNNFKRHVSKYNSYFTKNSPNHSINSSKSSISKNKNIYKSIIGKPGSIGNNLYTINTNDVNTNNKATETLSKKISKKNYIQNYDIFLENFINNKLYCDYNNKPIVEFQVNYSFNTVQTTVFCENKECKMALGIWDIRKELFFDAKDSKCKTICKYCNKVITPNFIVLEEDNKFNNSVIEEDNTCLKNKTKYNTCIAEEDSSLRNNKNFNNNKDLNITINESNKNELTNNNILIRNKKICIPINKYSKVNSSVNNSSYYNESRNNTISNKLVTDTNYDNNNTENIDMLNNKQTFSNKFLIKKNSKNTSFSNKRIKSSMFIDKEINLDFVLNDISPINNSYSIKTINYLSLDVIVNFTNIDIDEAELEKSYDNISVIKSKKLPIKANIINIFNDYKIRCFYNDSYKYVNNKTTTLTINNNKQKVYSYSLLSYFEHIMKRNINLIDKKVESNILKNPFGYLSINVNSKYDKYKNFKSKQQMINNFQTKSNINNNNNKLNLESNNNNTTNKNILNSMFEHFDINQNNAMNFISTIIKQGEIRQYSNKSKSMFKKNNSTFFNRRNSTNIGLNVNEKKHSNKNLTKKSAIIDPSIVVKLDINNLISSFKYKNFDRELSSIPNNHKDKLKRLLSEVKNYSSNKKNNNYLKTHKSNIIRNINNNNNVNIGNNKGTIFNNFNIKIYNSPNKKRHLNKNNNSIKLKENYSYSPKKTSKLSNIYNYNSKQHIEEFKNLVIDEKLKTFEIIAFNPNINESNKYNNINILKNNKFDKNKYKHNQEREFDLYSKCSSIIFNNTHKDINYNSLNKKSLLLSDFITNIKLKGERSKNSLNKLIRYNSISNNNYKKQLSINKYNYNLKNTDLNLRYKKNTNKSSKKSSYKKLKKINVTRNIFKDNYRNLKNNNNIKNVSFEFFINFDKTIKSNKDFYTTYKSINNRYSCSSSNSYTFNNFNLNCYIDNNYYYKELNKNIESPFTSLLNDIIYNNKCSRRLSDYRSVSVLQHAKHIKNLETKNLKDKNLKSKLEKVNKIGKDKYLNTNRNELGLNEENVIINKNNNDHKFNINLDNINNNNNNNNSSYNIFNINKNSKIKNYYLNTNRSKNSNQNRL